MLQLKHWLEKIIWAYGNMVTLQKIQKSSDATEQFFHSNSKLKKQTPACIIEKKKKSKEKIKSTTKTTTSTTTTTTIGQSLYWEHKGI